ncbi:4-hydroxy-tetrahydrodipicolinate reductase [Paenisporosarcina cavernae]|uniref:4-hydroxy-tetrahydrodipicolinate reductase n=1 Tax=Paenisporosarcina cavernae TaxID=2320858 RepID=A0A385YSC2_9BACL|nr:4-hydroxy-tetrahydrodipicolinate reductase [Paenisporosarcina cavernae]AYC29404.1 4-hydroxy-tetrahydrodipicolinate reductase [Paenisporosarcina cavernae]
MIRVALAGPRGRMGSEAVHTLMKNSSIDLVAVLDYKEIGKVLSETSIFPANYEIPVYNKIEELLQIEKPDVFLDLTTPESVYDHAEHCLTKQVKVVIGTTGMSEKQSSSLQKLSDENQTACIIAPNFALGAIMMMKFAKMAAAYFPDVEIIELHHDQKLDAPSGTATKTASLISEVRKPHQQGHPEEKEVLQGARGASYQGIPIHSVRLPGFTAHQKVIFGDTGQLLTIQHDSMSRQSFMSGIVFAIEKVMQTNDYIVGLENLLTEEGDLR